jgi:hypothetical protein
MDTDLNFDWTKVMRFIGEDKFPAFHRRGVLHIKFPDLEGAC